MKLVTVLSVLLGSLIVFAAAPLGQIASQSRGDPQNKKEAKKAMIEWGPEKDGLRCAVALASKEKIFAAEPVQVLFLTKNVGAKSAPGITIAHPLAVYTLRVMGPDGKPAPLTSYGRQQKEAAGDGSRGTPNLALGEEDKSELLLSRFFDMTLMGDYKVSFSRLVLVNNALVPVTSNDLTIAVAGEKADYVPK